MSTASANATIRARMAVGFAAILGLMIALTVIGDVQVDRISAGLARINEVNSVKQRHAINFRGSVHDRAIALRDVTLVAESEVAAVVADIDRLEAFYRESAGPLDAMMADPTMATAEDRATLQRIKVVENRTSPLIKEVIAKRRGGDGEGARVLLMTEARPAFTEWLKVINEFIDLQERKNNVESAMARDTAAGFELLMISLTAAALVIGALLAWWAMAALTPLRRLTDAMLKLADGDLSVTIPPSRSTDEIGQITGAVEVFKRNAAEADALRGRQAEMARDAETRRKAEMAELARGFESQMSGVVSGVSSSSTKMRGSAQSLSATAEDARRRVDEVASASRDASANVQTVAAAAEELSASITEIGRRITDSASKARTAADQADGTNRIVDGLSDKANQIGDVVQLINNIAAQTNLLALNATIEAARAGDAGKGFAVVASEVKTLANQTAQATEDISKQIADIQAATSDAVRAIKSIAETIGQVNDISGAISLAVDQQRAATQEISVSVQRAARSSGTVADAIDGVRDAAEQTGVASSQVLTAANELTGQADALRGQVERFLAGVRG